VKRKILYYIFHAISMAFKKIILKEKGKVPCFKKEKKTLWRKYIKYGY